MRIYKRSIELVIIQGLQVLSVSGLRDHSIRPPVKKSKRGRPKVARI
jgi:hypothetical protein